MAEEKKEYWLVTWVEYNKLRGRVINQDFYTQIIDIHPAQFLIDCREALGNRYQAAITFTMKLEVSGHQVAAWKRKLDG